MSLIVNIPIEPTEFRYSGDWDKWFKKEFQEHDLNFTTVYGEKVSNVIENGSFLDVCNTNIYKTSQMLKIIKILSKYDDQETLILFFHDLWFPGLETIAYIRDGMGFKNLKIYGCLHAGSYDEYDFLNKQGMTKWANHMETGWFNVIVDKIFVATNFHKDLLCKKRRIKPGKIYVTGFPIFTPKLRSYDFKKQNIILFPHRLDSEKNPNLFNDLKEYFVGSNWEFIKTVEVVDNKDDYYSLLARAKFAISFSDQETWGIAMQEAVLLDCYPLVPNRLSYTEMYSTEFLFDNWFELLRKLENLMKQGSSDFVLGRIKDKIKYEGKIAISNMIKLF